VLSWPYAPTVGTDSKGAAATSYIKANLQSVATDLAALTGQRHPLATSGHRALDRIWFGASP
jgi:hypothetical protein